MSGLIRYQEKAQGAGRMVQGKSGYGGARRTVPSMTQEQKDRIWYIKEFKGNECVCGGTKRPGSALCYGCFKLLPSSYQGALYLKIGDGYEEAYEDAIQWLREQDVIE